MIKNVAVFLFAVAVAAGAAQSADDALVQGQTRFALELYHTLGESKGNLFFSPYSISSALAMTSAGARGQTLQEMNAVLHLPSVPHPGFAGLTAQLSGQNKPYQLNTANRIWPGQGIEFYPTFLNIVKACYGADPQTLDYKKDPEGSRRVINKWVEDKTARKIKELIPSGEITPLTGMVLTNAIYFKGSWDHRFEVKGTKKEPFYADGGGTVSVDLMDQTATVPYGEAGGIQLVELPYKGDELSMLVILPKPGALPALEKSLTADRLDQWLGGLSPREVRIYLPKFTSRFKSKLNDPLKKLGMPTAFDREKADFGAMRRDNDLFISTVIHEAFVSVDEEGTEATAATGVTMALRGIPVPPAVFRADRPFVYAIRHRPTGALLFLGRFTRPE